jgi:DNA-directed RNA polymerase subunit E'/Rpb7
MFKKVILEKNIDIEPQYLNKNLLNTIEEQFQKGPICTMKDGYIKSRKIISVSSNVISKIHNKLSFNIIYVAETIKPCKNMKIESIINNIFPSGVLLEYEKIKIFVPLSNITKNNYIINKNTLEKNSNENENIILKIGDKIKVVIQDVRFENKNFICVASIE